MKRKKYRYTLAHIAILFGVILVASCSNNQSEAVTLQNKIDSLTLKQKTYLVVGTGMYLDLPDSLKKVLGDRFEFKDKRDTVYINTVNRIRTYLPGAAGVSVEFPYLGISSQVLVDGPAGLRVSPLRTGDTATYYCTAFPIATMLASTWDTALVENVGKAMGNEALEYGADIILAPALNLQRDPLCGRNFEYYSEDPFASGKIAAAMVKGIQSNGVGTSIKHFAVNNQETFRQSSNSIVSERALRELYLKGFEIAVKEGKPWTVMTSYNKINGVYASESFDLLTTILRDEWGFGGYVMTDWGGGNDVVAQLKAGNDMLQPGTQEQMKEIYDAVQTGKLDSLTLDNNVKRILGVIEKTPRFKNYKHNNKPDLKNHADITRQAASEGIVLLENESQTLPLSKDIKEVGLFGCTSYDFISGGSGSGDVNEAYTVSLTQGLETAGYSIDKTLQEKYESYIKAEKANQFKGVNPLLAMFMGKRPIEEMKVSETIVKNIAEKSDIGMITIGRNAGEGGDRKAEKGDFYLNNIELELVKNVTEAFHRLGKKVVVILNIPGVIDVESWKDIPDAVLCVWQPGQEAGNSVADVISGKVNPSGKLTTTFPKSYNDTPTFNNFPGHPVDGSIDDRTDLSGFTMGVRVPYEVIYAEDIYVGYRYYNSFKVPVSYEFGYGKSYTDFDYSDLVLSNTEFNQSLTVTVDVKNVGKYAGKEVVQLYISAPESVLEKPEEELKGFAKTRLLQPGETQKLTFKITPEQLASFYDDQSEWIADAGIYTVKIGASCLNIKLSSTFKLARRIETEKVNNVLLPEVNFIKLSRNGNN